MSVGDLLHSRRWKVFMNYVYNIAGALVIIGALFKLMHWPFAGIALTVGMCTEAVIFLISSLEPVHEQPEWSKVFPELSDDYVADENGMPTRAIGASAGGGLNMGGIFDKADIAPEVLEKLSKGLTDLGNTASSISDISSATLATNVYVDNLNSASESMSALANVGQEAGTSISDSLTKLADSCQKISGVVEAEVSGIDNSTKAYSEKVSSLNANLDQLSSTYEKQLAAINTQFESSQKFNNQMVEITSVIGNSLEEMKKYQTLSSELNKNLEALNTIYGNMLGSMNYKK